jgi:hypothetical protein
MANTITNKKFGVVHGSPSQLSTATIEEGKLYFLAGDADGVIKQGIYGVEGVTPDGSGNITDYKLAMFGTGAVADGTGYGLSQENFTTALKTALNNLSNIGVATKTADGYVPMADGSAGTIDNQASDWVLAFDGSKVDWFKLPAEAFNNTTYNSGNVITIANNKNINHNTSGVTAGRYGDIGDTRSLAFGGTFNVVDTSVDSYGHVTAISTKTLTLPSKPSTAGTADKVAQTFDVSFGGADILTYNGSANKTLAFKEGTNIDISNSNGTLTISTTGVPTTTEMNTAIATALTSALKYKGTVANSSALTSADKTQGSVYVASASFTTTTAQTGKAYTVEAGDYFISNGTTFDVVNGENQVSNANATLAWNTSTKIASVDGTDIYVKLPSNPNTDTKVTAVGNHYTPSSDASYKLTKTASSSYSATWGSTDMITGITLQRDAAGHVTDVSISSIQMPSNPNTDTKVTAVGNHYAPSADASKELKVDASSSTAATWGQTELVTGVNIQRDAAGHVTGVTVDSIQMPSNPNTDTMVKDASVATKSYILGHAIQSTTAEAQTNSSCYMSGGYLYSGGSKVLTSATDTKCTSLTLSADTAVEDPSTKTSVDVILNVKIDASGSGTSLTGSMSAVKVPTQKAVDAAQEAATIYWETL